MDAARRWAEDLAAWAIPPEILAAAPESPWGFPPSLFAHAASHPGADSGVSNSTRRAAEALPAGGSVLDVGAGAGAASLPLAPPAGNLTAVDQSRPMLEAFAAGASGARVAHTEVEGSWPDVAGQVAPADVVVCHHVLYNVADLVPFVTALTAAARRRVVVEITAEHPQSSLTPLWQQFHGIDRPSRPTADDAIAVLADLRLDPGVEPWEAPFRWIGAPDEEVIAFVRRRLCLPAERDPEVAAALGPPVPRRLVTLWWPGGAGET